MGIFTRGARTRDTPDWFHRQIRTTYENVSNAGNPSVAWLANNGIDNLYLHVYGLTIQVVGGSYVSFEFAPNPGTDSGNGRSQLSPDFPAVSGISDNYIDAPPGGAQSYSQVWIPEAGWTWPYQFPVAIIPPNMCWVIQTVSGSVNLAVTWWWAALPVSRT
jgi:hypothetical protein